MGFQEFSVAARHIGYGGSVREIFAELDDDNSGILALSEFAPEETEILDNFTSFCHRRFGTIKEFCQALQPTPFRYILLLKAGETVY